MRYDVVISTLNRAETLRTCLSLIEAQSEKPARAIIVDASDDHDAVKARVMADRDPSIDWVFLKSQKKSLPFQRNTGLEHVQSDVALMPDDDSMLYPGTAAEMLAAYRADKAGEIAGVSGIAAPRHPLAAVEVQIERGRAIKDRIEPVRNGLENRFMPKPFNSYPQSIWRSRPTPDWIDGERFALVETVGGFLLSLRADVIKAHRFDETLGYGIGYALHEDMELSMRLQRAGYLLAGARQAPIFHDVHPSKRAGGFEYGFCWIANYIYACRRNIPADHPAFRTHLPRFMQYKLTLYRARAVATRDPHNRSIFVGARTAWDNRRALIEASPERLADVYRSLCDSFVRKKG